MKVKKSIYTKEKQCSLELQTEYMGQVRVTTFCTSDASHQVTNLNSHIFDSWLYVCFSEMQFL